MSFVKALAAVAVGIAAAKGMEKHKQISGMAGVQDAMKFAGSSDLAEQMGKMADQVGVPGGSQVAKDMLHQMDQSTAAAGLAGLMSSFGGVAETGTHASAEMMESIFGQPPAAAAMETQAKLMIRTMIQAARADGEIDTQEQAATLDKLGDIGEAEQIFVRAELEKPVNLLGLIQDASKANRDQIYATSLSAIRPDNDAEKLASHIWLPGSVAAPRRAMPSTPAWGWPR